MGRRPIIDWDSWEPLEIGIWCEARRTELTQKAKRPRLIAFRFAAAFEPLQKIYSEIGRRQQALIETRKAIHTKLLSGEIDKFAANVQWSGLRADIEKTYADFKKLQLRYNRTFNKVLRGRRKDPDKPLPVARTVRPWGLEETILAEAAAHFSKAWSSTDNPRTISKRAVRSAWDDYRSILRDADRIIPRTDTGI